MLSKLLEKFRSLFYEEIEKENNSPVITPREVLSIDNRFERID